MQKVYLGFDPGLSGGITFLNEHNQIIVCEPMPMFDTAKGKKELDLNGIVKIIKRVQLDNEIVMVGIEAVHAMPKQGVSSVFKFGTGFGSLLGIVSAMELPYKLIMPRTWQKQAFESLSKADTKQMSSIVCERLWPGFDFRQSKRCKKNHDGMTDSCLIALYIKKNY
jgi:crossover junction endodeoxyribonuclease RuvC